jgi:hypothetical protein
MDGEKEREGKDNESAKEKKSSLKKWEKRDCDSSRATSIVTTCSDLNYDMEKKGKVKWYDEEQ